MEKYVVTMVLVVLLALAVVQAVQINGLKDAVSPAQPAVVPSDASEGAVVVPSGAAPGPSGADDAQAGAGA